MDLAQLLLLDKGRDEPVQKVNEPRVPGGNRRMHEELAAEEFVADSRCKPVEELVGGPEFDVFAGCGGD